MKKTTNGIAKKKTSRKNVRKKEENLRKGLKNSSGFMFSLFVNILIVFLIVKILSGM